MNDPNMTLFIPIIMPPSSGRSGIGIHALFLERAGKWKGTDGCIRGHNTDSNDLANFVEKNCKNERNAFVKP